VNEGTHVAGEKKREDTAGGEGCDSRWRVMAERDMIAGGDKFN
jgi:hypothetical protein